MAIHQDMFQQSATGDADFRKVCDELCTAQPEQPRLKTIAAVGAYDATIGGKGVDSRRLTGVVTYLLQSGILIDPAFDIDVVNFREKRDFLIEDKSADLVFISLILAQHIFRATYYYSERLNELAAQRRDYRYIFGTALSTENSATAWKKRIQGAGAKVVATFGGKDEIGTHTLAANINDVSLLTLIKTPDAHMALHVDKEDGDPDDGGFELRTKTELSRLYNLAAYDLPMPWLGFAAAPAYLGQVKNGLSDKTVLGVNARRIALKL